jgi:DNA-binding NarL/FixJ family response regulator
MNHANGITIAIVDDHLMMRNCIYDAITQWGYVTTLQASNGKELFCQLTKENAPDICILDLNMPGMNGYETIWQLKEDWPQIKILVFSMNVTPGTNYTLQFGAEAELSKTADVSELKKILAQLCQKSIPPK